MVWTAFNLTAPTYLLIIHKLTFQRVCIHWRCRAPATYLRKRDSSRGACSRPCRVILALPRQQPCCSLYLRLTLDDRRALNHSTAFPCAGKWVLTACALALDSIDLILLLTVCVLAALPTPAPSELPFNCRLLKRRLPFSQPCWVSLNMSPLFFTSEMSGVRWGGWEGQPSPLGCCACRELYYVQFLPPSLGPPCSSYYQGTQGPATDSVVKAEKTKRAKWMRKI